MSALLIPHDVASAAVTRPARIVHVVQHLKPGGIETMALDFLDRKAEGLVHIVSLEGTLDEASTAWPRLDAVADRLRFLGKADGVQPATVWRLATLFRSMRADVVHTHHIGPLLYGGLAARLAGVRRVVHTEHDAWYLEQRAAARQARTILGLVRPKLVADADLVARRVAAATGHHATVILNGIAVDRFTPGDQRAARCTLGLPLRVPLIGTAGRLVPVKNQARLLAALAWLGINDRDNSAHLAIAGEGPERVRLEEIARQLGLADRVHFLGRVDAMPTFYRALDAFCLSSDKEGLPLSLLEAQACGVPAVTTDAGAAREAVCPDTGRVVPLGNTIALAHGLCDGLAGNRSRSPRAFVLAKGDAAAMQARYEGIYR